MLNKKLWISILLRSRPHFLSTLFPKQKLSRVFSCSYHISEPRVYIRFEDHFIGNFGFPKKNFCSQVSTLSVSKCWNCNAVALSKPFLACESCRCVQPVDPSVDYFQIFGLKKIYGIDDTNLESKYKNWQKKLHPDLVHSKSEKEKEYAAEQSARVIDAYRTLQKPLLRAMYLLQMEGIHVDEEKTVSEPELLAEMMEFREAVEEAGSPQTLKQIQGQVQEKMEVWSKYFENAFKNRKFDDAISSTQRMTYYHRINEEIIKKL
ncbi:iron-sulfur cluster co-chaperone protein HscB protein [Thalictrum thalictroides]|uniref:Iron-sulfur cluster co-chaperone protein HscB protein n=1 Tax=Thalictrum thalictroides TaxID=46969 RepID=A0A7J6VLL8_THATH|nr:iron-sulfur cluster co-chaperone protein HscB protein [Thalictrum thalictroides]